MKRIILIAASAALLFAPASAGAKSLHPVARFVTHYMRHGQGYSDQHPRVTCGHENPYNGLTVCRAHVDDLMFEKSNLIAKLPLTWIVVVKMAPRMRIIAAGIAAGSTVVTMSVN